MRIAYEKFRIVPCDHAPGRFDLVKIITRQKLGTGTTQDPKGETYEAEIDISLGCPLVNCIEDILHIQTVTDLGEKDVSLIEFMQKYEEKKSSLRAEFNTLLNIKIN